MIISRITTHILRAPIPERTFYSSQAAFPERNSLLVRVEANNGLVGWGEGGQYGPPSPVASQLLAFEQEVEALQFLEQRLATAAQRLGGVVPELVLLGDGRIGHDLDIGVVLLITPDQVVDVPARSDHHQRRVLGEARHPVVGEPVPHPVAVGLGYGFVASLVRVVEPRCNSMPLIAPSTVTLRNEPL